MRRPSIVASVVVLAVVVTGWTWISPPTRAQDADEDRTSALETRVAELEERVGALEGGATPTALPLATPVAAPPIVPDVPAPPPGPPTPPSGASAATGSRDDPIPIGSAARVGDWSIVVLGVNPDATAAVLTGNQFNAPPQAGRQFFLVRVAASYLGTGSATIASSVGFEAVGASAVAYSTFDPSCGVIPDQLPSAEVFEGGTIEGNVCFQVRTEDVDSLVLFVEPFFSFDDDRIFFALRSAADAGTAGDGSVTIVAGDAAAAGGPFEVVSVDIAFEPAALTIPAGQDVVVNIPNTGALPHNFSIDELNISVDQPAGSTGTVTINAPPGTYTYYCNVPGHRAAGMEGTLTVQ